MQGLQELNERVQARRDTTMAEMWTELTRPEIIKPCLLLVTLMCLMMANGATVIVFYAVSIIQVQSSMYVIMILPRDARFALADDL